MRKRLYLIFLGVFLISLLGQGVRYHFFDMTDSLVWGHEAEYFLAHDPRAYDLSLAYAQGAPVVEGTIVIHALTHLPYDTSVLVFVALFNSLLISLVALVSYLLRRNIWWTMSLPAILALNWLYYYATPPIVLASTLACLLVLLTIYLYENKSERSVPWILWGLIAGLLWATRVDIAILFTIPTLALLLWKTTWRQRVIIVGAGILAFVLTDPFMWQMPIQHIGDLFSKLLYHFSGEFAEIRLPLPSLFNISSLSCISIALGWVNRFKFKTGGSLPRPILFTITSITLATLLIFLSSHMQVERYLMPVIFVWEMLLPLFVLQLMGASELDKMNPSLSAVVVGLFYALELAMLAGDMSIYKVW